MSSKSRNNRADKLQESTKVTVVEKETISAILSSRTMIEASEKLGLSLSGLYRRIETYKLRPIIDEYREIAADTLLLNLPRAAQNLVDMMDDRKYKFEATKEVLDRAGVVKVEAKQQINVVGNDMKVDFLNYESTGPVDKVANRGSE